jgi:hypothetical protein
VQSASAVPVKVVKSDLSESYLKGYAHKSALKLNRKLSGVSVLQKWTESALLDMCRRRPSIEEKDAMLLLAVSARISRSCTPNNSYNIISDKEIDSGTELDNMVLNSS